MFLLLLVLLLPETLRSVVGNGSRVPSHALSRYPLTAYQKTTKTIWSAQSAPSDEPPKKHIDLTGPIRILFSKQASAIIVFLAIYYAVWQMSITAMSTLFQDRYHLGETQIGLTFMANGVGSMAGTLVTGRILDMDYRRIKARRDAQISASPSDGEAVNSTGPFFPIEYARLRLVPLFSLFQCLSILLFGWTINYPDTVPIAIPIVSTFVTGWTAVSTQSVVMTYLVDVYSDRSAAASASLNLARCLFAAGGTSVVTPLINGIGVGLAFTVCVAVQFVAMSGLAVQWQCGARWRRQAEIKRSQKQEQDTQDK